jgi:hypothetical protein
VQYASSQMRRYDTDRRAQAHLSVHYSVVKCGYTASVLIHCGEASPIGSSHNTTIRSLPKYPFPCYPECPMLGKCFQLPRSALLLLPLHVSPVPRFAYTSADADCSWVVANRTINAIAPVR